MPRIKHNIGGAADKLADATPASGGYAGKKPPKGIYRGTIRFLKLRGKKQGNKFVPQKNRSGNYMIAGAVSINEKGPKEKYNRYLVNFNQNISEQGSGYVNAMLDAMFDGSKKVRREFWESFVGTDLDGNITHIGKQRYTDNSISVVINTKDGKNREGLPVLEVASFLLPSAVEDTDDEDTEDEDEDGDDLDDIDVSDEETEDELDTEDEDSEDTSDEFEDEDEDSDSEGEDGEEDEDGDEDDEDEAEEDEEESEEEPDRRAVREEELKALSRKELLPICKERGIKGTKGVSEDELITRILDAEEEEPPF